MPSNPMIKILFLEDVMDDFFMVRDLLKDKQAGGSDMFFLERAATVADAKRHLQIEHYDLFLVDYYIAGPDGAEYGTDFIRHVIRRPPHPPTILLTGRRRLTLDGELIDWISQGRLSFMTKEDLNADRLYDTIRAALGTMMRILLVEDDKDDYELVRSYLALSPMYRFDIDWAKSVQEAREMVDNMGERQYDAYLIDYQLGELTGMDFVSELVALNIHQPMLLVTGFDDIDMNEDAIRLIGRRQLGFLTKSKLTTESLVQGIIHARNAASLFAND